MNPHVLTAALCALTAAIPAQINYTVRAATESGIAMERPDGTRVVQTFPAANTFATSSSLTIEEGGGILFGALATHNVGVPSGSPLPLPFGTVLERVQISTGARATAGTPRALHTTDNAAGDPGTQRYDVTLSAAGTTQALVTVGFSSQVFDNATLDVTVTGGGFNESWSASTPSSTSETVEMLVTIAGSTTLRVEVTGASTAGPGAGWWDGFSASVTIRARDVGNVGFSPFGNGCAGATFSGGGMPVAGQMFTVNLDNAPADMPTILIVGNSNTSYLFLPLPLPLGYLGAPGCDLNVAPMNLLDRMTDSTGHAEVDLYLNPFLVDPTVYLQWVVFDPALNAAGLGTTEGAALSW